MARRRQRRLRSAAADALRRVAAVPTPPRPSNRLPPRSRTRVAPVLLRLLRATARHGRCCARCAAAPPRQCPTLEDAPCLTGAVLATHDTAHRLATRSPALQRKGAPPGASPSAQMRQKCCCCGCTVRASQKTATSRSGSASGAVVDTSRASCVLRTTARLPRHRRDSARVPLCRTTYVGAEYTPPPSDKCSAPCAALSALSASWETWSPRRCGARSRVSAPALRLLTRAGAQLLRGGRVPHTRVAEGHPERQQRGQPAVACVLGAARAAHVRGGAVRRGARVVRAQRLRRGGAHAERCAHELAGPHAPRAGFRCTTS